MTFVSPTSTCLLIHTTLLHRPRSTKRNSTLPNLPKSQPHTPHKRKTPHRPQRLTLIRNIEHRIQRPEPQKRPRKRHTTQIPARHLFRKHRRQHRGEEQRGVLDGVAVGALGSLVLFELLGREGFLDLLLVGAAVRVGGVGFCARGGDGEGVDVGGEG